MRAKSRGLSWGVFSVLSRGSLPVIGVIPRRHDEESPSGESNVPGIYILVAPFTQPTTKKDGRAIHSGSDVMNSAAGLQGVVKLKAVVPRHKAPLG